MHLNARKIIVDQRHGRLTTLECVGSDHHRSKLWRCACDCGAEVYVKACNLGRSVSSCGCLKKHVLSTIKRKHGDCDSVEHSTWRKMRSRCSNRRSKDWPSYGGRGIQVCERWQSFEKFLEDMGRKPSPQHSLDRYPDNDGNYEPGNCRWATPAEQANNRRPRCAVGAHN